MKEAYVNEANKYFERNKSVIDEVTCSKHWINIADFYRRIKGRFDIKRVLEVGCCSGYNLLFFREKSGCDCYGIEPSDEAVAYGKTIVKNRQMGGCSWNGVFPMTCRLRMISSIL